MSIELQSIFFRKTGFAFASSYVNGPFLISNVEIVHGKRPKPKTNIWRFEKPFLMDNVLILHILVSEIILLHAESI